MALKIVLIVLGALTGGLFTAGWMMFNSFLRRNKDIYQDDALPGEDWAREYMDRYNEGSRWNEEAPGEEWTITSKDGLRLEAKFVPAKGEAVRNVILVHGWHSVYFKDFSEIGKWHVENGANVLFVTQRSCRRSEGKYMTMGVRESEDLAAWAALMDARTLGKLPMYFHGISMGAATVMMAEGEELPANVRGVVADCGFTSPWDMAKEIMKSQFGWMPFRNVLLHIVNFYTKTLAHFDMREKSTVKILKRSKMPTLFIHGVLDDFVPPHMTVKNYQACAAPKRLIMAEDATHALSWFYDHERYVKALSSFLEDTAGGRL